MEPKSQVQFLIIPQGIVAPRTRAANTFSSVPLAGPVADLAETFVDCVGALCSGRGVDHFLIEDVSSCSSLGAVRAEEISERSLPSLRQLIDAVGFMNLAATQAHDKRRHT